MRLIYVYPYYAYRALLDPRLRAQKRLQTLALRINSGRGSLAGLVCFLYPSLLVGAWRLPVVRYRGRGRVESGSSVI